MLACNAFFGSDNKVIIQSISNAPRLARENYIVSSALA